MAGLQGKARRWVWDWSAHGFWQKTNQCKNISFLFFFSLPSPSSLFISLSSFYLPWPSYLFWCQLAAAVWWYGPLWIAQPGFCLGAFVYGPRNGFCGMPLAATRFMTGSNHTIGCCVLLLLSFCWQKILLPKPAVGCCFNAKSKNEWSLLGFLL